MDFKNSPEFAKEVEDLFRMFDEDGSGMIDAKEVQVAASVLLGVSRRLIDEKQAQLKTAPV
ncbi:hypothetical protein DIPPA_11589 [Diplonema papillatum]|nr:hypothetical protein DIPPA_11589 [Diplonema papillatum]